jgi:HTH-type transcriptional regulator/antitoxin HigA
MTTVKYKTITRESQYRDYCNALERLLCSGSKDRDAKDEIA